MLACFCAAFGASSSRRNNEALNMLANYCVLLAATRLRPAREQRGSLSTHRFFIAKLVGSDARREGSHAWDTSPEQCVGELPRL